MSRTGSPLRRLLSALLLLLQHSSGIDPAEGELPPARLQEEAAQLRFGRHILTEPATRFQRRYAVCFCYARIFFLYYTSHDLEQIAEVFGLDNSARLSLATSQLA